jgi:hypothetical protein
MDRRVGRPSKSTCANLHMLAMHSVAAGSTQEVTVSGNFGVADDTTKEQQTYSLQLRLPLVAAAALSWMPQSDYNTSLLLAVSVAMASRMGDRRGLCVMVLD